MRGATQDTLDIRRYFVGSNILKLQMTLVLYLKLRHQV